MMPSKLPPQIIDPPNYKEHLNLMVFGPTGCGKTILGAQAPKILIFAVEPGVISAVKWMKKNRPGRKDFKIWNVNKLQDLVDGYEYLRDSLDEGSCPFEWVMIDTATKTQYRLWREIMTVLVEKHPHRDEDVPDRGEHFKMQLKMKRMVSDFNELPINVIWTAQPMNADLEGEDEERVIPLIEGKDGAISASIAADMDVVMYMRRMKVKRKGEASGRLIRRLYTQHHIYWCKDRFDVLPATLDDADFVKDIIEPIRNAEEKPTTVRKATKKTAAKRAVRKTTGARKRSA